MINKFNLAKALFDNVKAIADTNSFLLIANGDDYETNPNETFLQEIVLYGDDVSLGVSNNSSDIQLGIYQVNINTPKAQEGSKWLGLQMAGIIQSGFAKGNKLTFGSQLVTIKSTTLESMFQNDTHMVHILSIKYSVIN